MVETILLWSVRDHPFVVCQFFILLQLILMVLDALRDRVHLVLYCCCERVLITFTSSLTAIFTLLMTKSWSSARLGTLECFFDQQELE